MHSDDESEADEKEDLAFNQCLRIHVRKRLCNTNIAHCQPRKGSVFEQEPLLKYGIHRSIKKHQNTSEEEQPACAC